MGIHKTTRVQQVDLRGRPHGEERMVKELAHALGPCAFRRITWREATAKKLSSRFALRRVHALNGKEPNAEKREAEWLLIEWPEGHDEPTRYALSTLPKRMSKKQMVRLLKERYRTERAYQELKGELGLDHFEGRRFRGWHHPISVALCCYAFVVAERVRHFSPSAAGSTSDDALGVAA